MEKDKGDDLVKMPSLDYRKSLEVKVVSEIPEEGLWLPVSIAAQMIGFSNEMVRHFYKNEIMGSIRFKRGPILVNYTELKENYTRQRKNLKSKKTRRK